MKMIIKYDKSIKDIMSEQEMRTAFAHISHKIWIQSIARSDNIFTIEWDMQPGNQNTNFKELITQAVSMRAYLTLLVLEMPPKTITKPGLRFIRQDESSSTYQVSIRFLNYFATLEKCAAYVNKNVISVDFELQETDEEDTYTSTGTVAISTSPAQAAITNPYPKFLRILCNDKALRESILEDRNFSMTFTVNNNGTSLITKTQKRKVEELPANLTTLN